jgi:hypothetical protein
VPGSRRASKFGIGIVTAVRCELRRPFALRMRTRQVYKVCFASSCKEETARRTRRPQTPLRAAAAAVYLGRIFARAAMRGLRDGVSRAAVADCLHSAAHRQAACRRCNRFAGLLLIDLAWI